MHTPYEFFLIDKQNSSIAFLQYSPVLTLQSRLSYHVICIRSYFFVKCQYNLAHAWEGPSCTLHDILMERRAGRHKTYFFNANFTNCYCTFDLVSLRTN